MAVSTDYTGRLVDLFIFQNAKVSGEALIHLGFDGENGGKVTSGIQKMAQTWAILFLTERGSVSADPELGTDFVSNLRTGIIRDEATVRSEFGLAATLVSNNMLAFENADGLPDDEILDSAVLNNFNIDRKRGLLSLYVGLTSQAGTQHDILLPIPVAIR